MPSGTSCGCETFVSRVGRALGTRLARRVVVSNLAVSGATTTSVLGQLQAQPLRADLASADVVIVEVGANDLDEAMAADPACLPDAACFAGTVGTMAANVGRILQTAESAVAGRGGTVMALGYWNVFRDGAVGRSLGSTYVAVSDALTRRANAAIAAQATASGATYVDVYTPFKGTGSDDPTGALSTDGDHPNSTGHQLLADAVMAALLPWARSQAQAS